MFKEAGSPPEVEYVFNGVKYDHAVHKVSLGPRVLAKLQRDRFSKITYAQLETAVGRLLYASAVLGYVIPRFHFTLKLARRRINMLNRNLLLADKAVPLPKPTRCILASWRDEVLTNVPIEPPPHPDVVPHTHRLYTDASSKGWGAVLYLDDGQVQITGDSWPIDFKYEVNHAEGMAVTNALKDFIHHFDKGTCIDLYIDNASCQGAINRRVANSDNIARELKKVRRHNIQDGCWSGRQSLCSRLARKG